MVCDPGSELRLGGREKKKRAKIINEIKQRKKETKTEREKQCNEQKSE